MEKRVYNINCCPALFKAINLPWIKNTKQFFRIIKKLITLQWYLDIFSQIVFDQPFEAANILAVFFLCRSMINSFFNKTTFPALLLCEIGCLRFVLPIAKARCCKANLRGSWRRGVPSLVWRVYDNQPLIWK